MCGIAGYFCYGKKRPQKRILSNLLKETQSRGEHATGVSFIEDGALRVIKSPQSATEFVDQNEDWGALKQKDIPNYMIMHCRYKTKGDISNNMNNHPIFRDGLALVHNGSISNDDDLYEEFGFKRDAQVDTEAILAVLEDNKAAGWETMTDQIKKLQGSFAVAAIDISKPDTMCFFRHNNPIEFGLDVKNEILYFASTTAILNKAVVDNYRGFIDISQPLVKWDIGNDTGMIIDSKGVVDTFEFTISYYNKYTSRQTTNTTTTKDTTSTTTEADSDKRFSVCTGCKNNEGCKLVLKGTVNAYDCTNFKLELAQAPVGGSITDQCQQCSFAPKCDTEFDGDDFYKFCPLVNGGTDDMHIDSENADCTTCAKVDSCDDVYTLAPVECGKFKDRDFDITY